MKKRPNSEYRSLLQDDEEDFTKMESLSILAESVDLEQCKGTADELMKMHEAQNKEQIEMIRHAGTFNRKPGVVVADGSDLRRVQSQFVH